MALLSHVARYGDCRAAIIDRLPLLPSAAMSRRAAAGARGGAEFGAGLARVGGLEDFGAAGEFGLARFGAVGAVGQGFRAVHFVEVGFVDFGGAAAGSARGTTPATARLQGGLY